MGQFKDIDYASLSAWWDSVRPHDYPQLNRIRSMADRVVKQKGFQLEQEDIEYQVWDTLKYIRHIQHHAAGLATRLRRTAGISIEWIGRA